MNSDFPYLGSFEIEDVKCFRTKRVLDFSKNGKPNKWNIILGNNGTGKTTLLKSIVFSSPTTGVGDFSIEETGEKGPLFVPLAYFNTEIFRAPHNNYGNVLLNILNIGPTGEKIGIYGSRVYTGYDSKLTSIKIIAYGASRKMSNAALGNIVGEQDRHASLMSEKELQNGEEWLLQADYAVKSNALNSEKRFEKIKGLLIDILPDVHDFEFAHYRDTGMYVIAVTDHGKVPMRDLSHGYLTMMAWVLDFARRMFERFPESENPLAEPAICLVDEIDLHLHPSWQRRIIQDLDLHFPNTQFIVTSHSPLIVQAAPADANIVLLKKEDDGVKIYNHMDTIKNWRVDQILTSDLFGLETARPPQTEDAIRRRAEILSQKTLTKEDEALVASLEQQIGDLPVGETSDDIKAMEIIRNAARKLQGI